MSLIRLAFVLALVAFASGCGGHPDYNSAGARQEFGTGKGRVYDRGGLDPRLGSIAISQGGAHPNTNTSVKGTPAN